MYLQPNDGLYGRKRGYFGNALSYSIPSNSYESENKTDSNYSATPVSSYSRSGITSPRSMYSSASSISNPDYSGFDIRELYNKKPAVLYAVKDEINLGRLYEMWTSAKYAGSSMIGNHPGMDSSYSRGSGSHASGSKGTGSCGCATSAAAGSGSKK